MEDHRTMVAGRNAPPQILPPAYVVADAYAMQALARGEADADQQRRVLGWIINAAAATYDMSFMPGDPHLTSFAEGRRFVGNQIVKLTKLNTKALIKQQEDS